MKKILVATLAILALSTSLNINAQDSDALAFSGNVAMTSDYAFRGWSQTGRDPAIQGGFDAEFDGGFSVGTWASSVNFGDNTTIELDLYAGFSSSINDDVSWSVSFIRFEYPNNGESFDYVEFSGSISWGDVSVGMYMSPEYLGDGGPSFTYPFADYSLSLSESVSLDLHVGMSMADEDDFFGDSDSYIDYSASITTPIAGLDVSAALVGTDLDDDASTETRFILSLSKSL